MFSPRRVAIAVGVGLVWGVISFLPILLVNVDIANAHAQEIGPGAWAGFAGNIVGTGLVGFVVGISSLTMPWWLHGPVLGLALRASSFFVQLVFLLLSGNSDIVQAVSSLVLLAQGGLTGLVIELFTTVVFRAPSPYVAGARTRKSKSGR